MLTRQFQALPRPCTCPSFSSTQRFVTDRSCALVGVLLSVASLHYPCSLSGTLPKAIAAANFLTQLRLGNNKLAGTVVSPTHCVTQAAGASGRIFYPLALQGGWSH